MIHVITPFSRPHNIEKICHMLRREKVMWHPIPHEDVKFPQEPWIAPVKIQYPDHWIATGGACYFKMNEFLEKWIMPEDHYMVLCDDDKIENGFFDSIRPYLQDVNICSMRMLDGEELIAAPQNCVPSKCGFEQLIIKGSEFIKFRYHNHCQADGRLIKDVYTIRGVNIRYFPDTFVLFNAL